MVSVIVPAYNVENCLEACLGSVLSQTAPDWELIVVDDGSTDGTAAICDRFTASDARVRCVHQPNQGVAAARNAGIELARGEWLMFLDGDDALESDILEKLLERATDDVDIVCCGFTAFSEERGFARTRSFLMEDRDMRNMREKEPLFLQLEDGRIGQSPGRAYTAIGVPWAKLYRASLIRERALRFPPMRLYEDNIFNMYAFTLARRIVYIDKPLYRYRVDHCTSYKFAPEPRLLALQKRDEYYERYGDLATDRMREERYREKLRFLGASCKYFARAMPPKEAAKEIRALCAQPVYARMLSEAAPCAVPARYRLLRALLRLRLWRTVALLSARIEDGRHRSARRKRARRGRSGS